MSQGVHMLLLAIGLIGLGLVLYRAARPESDELDPVDRAGEEAAQLVADDQLEQQLREPFQAITNDIDRTRREGNAS